MLELRNISYRVGDKALLDRVSLKIHPGEVVAIVGANGAGKNDLNKHPEREKDPTIW
jgi:ABC-type hemin transport system, ATPase component